MTAGTRAGLLVGPGAVALGGAGFLMPAPAGPSSNARHPSDLTASAHCRVQATPTINADGAQLRVVDETAARGSVDGVAFGAAAPAAPHLATERTLPEATNRILVGDLLVAH